MFNLNLIPQAFEISIQRGANEAHIAAHCLMGTSDVQTGHHLIPRCKEAEQSYGAYTYSLRAFMAHTKLEMRDASLPTCASLDGRIWGGEPVSHISVMQ